MSSGNHSFSVKYAIKYGVNQAILICSFQIWLGINRAKQRHFHNGRWWTYNSIRAMAKSLPYWTPRQIEYGIKKLVDDGVLMQDFDLEPVDSNRTSWYAFVDEKEFLPVLTSGENHFTNLGNAPTPFHKFGECISQNCEMVSKEVQYNGISTTTPTTTAVVAKSDADWATQALRFYNERLNDLVKYHRVPPSRSARTAYLDAFEFHFQSGHPLTEDALKAAVAAACASWLQKGLSRCPVAADPVLVELGSLINPMPQPAAPAAPSRAPVAPANPAAPPPAPAPEPAGALSDLARRLLAAGTSRATAAELSETHPAECERQLQYLPHRGARDPGAVLAKSIREGWSAPPGWAEAQEKAAKSAQQQARRVQATQRAEQQQAAEAAFDTWFAALPADRRDELTAQALSQLRQENRMMAEFARKHPDSPVLAGALKPLLKRISGWETSRGGDA